jgi:aspartate/methionine/tyrosine aminotransferase
MENLSPVQAGRDVREDFFAYWSAVDENPEAIDLGMGMPPTTLLPKIVAPHRKFLRALLADRTTYQPPGGIPALRESIAAFERDRTGLSVSSENVMVVGGALRAFSLVVAELLPKVERVVEPLPTYPLLAGHVRNLLSDPSALVTIAPRPGDEPTYDLDAVLAVCDRPSLVFLTNPNNPLGRYANPERLAEIARKLHETGGYLIVDEACDIPLHGVSRSFAWADCPSVIRINSFSKSLLLAGARIGYIVAPAALIQRYLHLYAFSDGNAPTIANQIVLARLGDNECWSEIRASATHNAAATLVALRDHRRITHVVTPEACYYILIRVAGARDSWSLFQHLLTAGVNVVPGDLFGLPGDEGWLRICCAREPEVLQAGLRCLMTALP